jgi:hypothetical protein
MYGEKMAGFAGIFLATLPRAQNPVKKRPNCARNQKNKKQRRI